MDDPTFPSIKNAAREDGVAGPLDMDPIPIIAETDIDPHVGFTDVEEFESQVILERHERHHVRDRAHVDLTQEEYTPEEVARLVGTSLEVVMHDIWNHSLKADRRGHHVTCIKHEDVTDWLRRRLAQ